MTPGLIYDYRREREKKGGGNKWEDNNTSWRLNIEGCPILGPIVGSDFYVPRITAKSMQYLAPTAKKSKLAHT